MSRSLALLCLLGAAVLAPCVLAGPNRQFVAERAHAGQQAKPASAYGHANTKHLCLREAKQHHCRYIGCPDVEECNDGGERFCYDCVHHLVAMSELTCCSKSSYGYGYDDDVNEVADFGVISASAGTCTWDADIYTEEGIELENGAVKIGTVWATCYMNNEADKCGHPFCDSMVLSVQGGAYLMEAYVNNNTRVPAELDGPPSEPTGCFGFDTDFLEPQPDPEFGPGPATATAQAKAPAPAKAKKGPLPAHKMSAITKLLAKSSLRKRLARHHTKSAAAKKGPAAKHVGGHHVDAEWAVGTALVFSGQVEVTSLHHRIEYTRGMLEYVPLFRGEAASIAAPGSSATIVEPNTYHIALTKSGASYE